MEFVLLALVILGKLLAWTVLFLLALVLVFLLTPVRLRFSGAGRFAGWSALMENDLDIPDEAIIAEGSFEGSGSIMGGLAAFSVKGSSGPFDVLSLVREAGGANLETREKGEPAGGPSFSKGRVTTEIRILGFTLRPGGARGKRGPSGAAGEAETKKRDARRTRRRRAAALEERRRGKFAQILEMLRREDFRSKVMASGKAVLKALHVTAGGKIDFGLGDPGATGMTYGLCESFLGVLGITGIVLTPEFDEDVLAGDVSVGSWFIPAQVAFLVARIMLSRPVRPLWLKRGREKRPAEPAMSKNLT